MYKGNGTFKLFSGDTGRKWRLVCIIYREGDIICHRQTRHTQLYNLPHLMQLYVLCPNAPAMVMPFVRIALMPCHTCCRLSRCTISRLRLNSFPCRPMGCGNISHVTVTSLESDTEKTASSDCIAC